MEEAVNTFKEGVFIPKDEALYIIRNIKKNLYGFFNKKNINSAQRFVDLYKYNNSSFTNSSYPGKIISSIKSYQDLIKNSINPKVSSCNFIDKYSLTVQENDLIKNLNELLFIPNSFISAPNNQCFIYNHSDAYNVDDSSSANDKIYYTLLNVPHKIYNKYQILRSLYFASKILTAETYIRQDIIDKQYNSISSTYELSTIYLKNELILMELYEFIYGLEIIQNLENINKDYLFTKLKEYETVFEHISPVYLDTEFNGYRSLLTMSSINGYGTHCSNILLMYKKYNDLVFKEDFNYLFSELPYNILFGNTNEDLFNKINSLSTSIQEKDNMEVKPYDLDENVSYKINKINILSCYFDKAKSIIEIMLSNINKTCDTNSSTEEQRNSINTENTQNQYRTFSLLGYHIYQKLINNRWCPCDENEAKLALGIEIDANSSEVSIPEVRDNPAIINEIADNSNTTPVITMQVDQVDVANNNMLELPPIIINGTEHRSYHTIDENGGIHFDRR